MTVTEHVTHSLPIEAYPEYRVCLCGLIISLKRADQPTVMAAFARGAYGHRAVNLCVGGVMKMESVSRLVAKAFLPQPTSDQTFVLHRDDDPANNRADNLRWGTPADNSADMTAKGRQCRGSKRPLAKLTEQDVTDIRRMVGGGTRQNKLAVMYGVSVATLNDIVLRKTWRHI